MTDLVDICNGLSLELRKQIVKIAPSERGSERFVPRDPTLTGDIRENSGRPRTFWVEPLKVTPTQTGCSVRRYYIDWALVIGYPPHGWEIAAASDLDDLRVDINVGGGYSTVTGVGYRVIPPVEGAMTWERDHNWMWSTIQIQSVVETTATTKTLPNYQTHTETSVTVAGSPVTVYSFTPTSDGGIVWSYHLIDSAGKTSRGGLISASWDVSANTAAYWDESTSDIVEAGYTYADTTGVTFVASMSGGIVYLKASSAAGTWTVRTTEISRSQEQ